MEHIDDDDDECKEEKEEQESSQSLMDRFMVSIDFGVWTGKEQNSMGET